MADVSIRRDEKLLCGRLVALPSTTTTMYQTGVKNNPNLANILSIDFPAMPDTIELARSAEYAVSQNNIVVPDGIHQYKGTKPLEIPFSFRLHSFDELYCKKGALTLLQLAARLHSFVLPINTHGRSIPALAQSTSKQIGGGRWADAQLNYKAKKHTQRSVTGASASKTGGLYNPVTCWLSLMWTGQDSPGISAIGYVRDVSVKLNGPWLRGPNNSFNLPTSGDFSFVFIHRPGHGNAQEYNESQQPDTLSKAGQAFADDVKDNFYNTRHLVHAASYQGFANDPSNETTPP